MNPIKRADLSLFEHDPEEKIIGEAGRHPIILFFIVLNAVFLIAVLLASMVIFAKYEHEAKSSIGLEQTPQLAGWIAILIIILVVLIIVGSLVAVYVHFHNYIVLTDHKLIIVRSRNLFSRKISQLSIGDVQDITVKQDTLLSRLFNYGSLNIETAGEQANFRISFVPNPVKVAKAIVDAHEANLKLYGN